MLILMLLTLKLAHRMSVFIFFHIAWNDFYQTRSSSLNCAIVVALVILQFAINFNFPNIICHLVLFLCGILFALTVILNAFIWSLAQSNPICFIFSDYHIFVSFIYSSWYLRALYAIVTGVYVMMEVHSATDAATGLRDADYSAVVG